MPWDFEITVNLLSDAWNVPALDVRYQLVSNAKVLLEHLGYSTANWQI